MTIQGIFVLILIGLVLLVWILDLIRRDRLYVGYGIVFIIAILSVILILAIPSLLMTVTHLVGAIFPASALTLLALCFIVFLLVYILSQVTIVSNRLAALVQTLAIQQAQESARLASQQTNATKIEQ
ncbi:MAG: DUF2304 domain-containing protein [Blastocatellales bacterium]